MKKIRMFLLMFAGICLPGCGSKTDNHANTLQANTGANQEEYIYVAETEDFVSTDYISGICMAADKMFISTYNEEKKDNHVFTIDLTSHKSTPLRLPLEEKGASMINGMTLNPEGDLVFIERYVGEDSNEQRDCVLIKTCAPSGGEVLSTLDVTSQINRSEKGFINGFLVDRDNNYYLFIDKTIQVLNSQGQQIFQCNPGIKWFSDVCLTKDGEVAFLAASDNEDGHILGIIDAKKQTVDRVYHQIAGDIQSGVLSQGTESNFVISSGDEVSLFSPEEVDQRHLFSWAESGLIGDRIRFLKSTEDGNFIAVLTEASGAEYHTQIAFLTKTLRAEVPQKEKLILATYMSSPRLEEEVNYFNQNSQDYQVEVKAYCRENAAYEEQAQAYNDMMLDMLTGKGADLVNGQYFDAELFASHGLTEDLMPFLQADDDLKDVEFFQSVLQGNSVNGELVCIPGSFCIETLAADARLVGDRQGMTIDEMMELMKEYDGDAVPFLETPERIVTSIFMSCINDFVNWEDGSCSFDSREFEKILEFSKLYGLSSETAAADIEMGSQLFVTQYVNNIAKYKAENLYAKANLFDGNGYGWVGYPVTETDSSNGTRLVNGQTFWMNSQSAKKEGAWEFIKTFLMPEYYEKQMEKDILSVDFPSRKDMYELVCAEWMATETGQNENGEEIQVSKHSYYGGLAGTFFDEPIIEEDKTEITELIEGMGTETVYNQEISSIIAEEAQPFFRGQKSAEEVSEIIQSRVQLYVNEKR